MISIQNCVPDIYYKQSRDFQLLGRLYEVALNYTKATSDMIYTIPNSNYADSSLINILATTLGFKQKHEYSSAQLAAVCSILPTILRLKGTMAAISIVCQTILNAENITEEFYIEELSPQYYELLVPKLQNTNLLYDILEYIIPFGVSYSITETAKLTHGQYNTVSEVGDDAIYVCRNSAEKIYADNTLANTEISTEDYYPDPEKRDPYTNEYPRVPFDSTNASIISVEQQEE